MSITTPRPLLTKLFNIVSDVGVQLSAGNACLFWNGSLTTQAISLIALTAGLGIKTFQEFSPQSQGWLADSSTAFKAATVSVAAIGVDSLWGGHYAAGMASLCFATGNTSLMGLCDAAKENLSNIFGKASAQIMLGAETWFTAGLGLAAYMAAGDSTVQIPGMEVHIPTSMLTFIPTAIGGVLSIRNALSGQDDKGKPLLWMAGGLAATAGVGLSSGAPLPGTANAFFSSAYIKMQTIKEDGYQNLGKALRKSISASMKRVFG